MIFEDWFTNHFVPGVERYCASKGLPFKVLLMLDNAPGHPAHLDDFHSNVVYFPPIPLPFYSLWTKESLPLSRPTTSEGQLLWP